MSQTSPDTTLHCWNTKIPCRITLSANEISTPANLKPIYMLLPRQGYLPKFANDALQFFKHVLANLPGHESLQPWFDYKGLPLKWSLPIGVLYDLMVDVRELPWELTIHLQGCPEIAVALDGRQTMMGLYLNALKEAAFICRGGEGPSAVMQMSGNQQEELWTAVQCADYKEYQRVLDIVRLNPTHRSGVGPCIPVRLLLRVANDSGFLSMWDLTYSTSRPVDAYSSQSDLTLLSDTLTTIRPALLEHLQPSSSHDETHIPGSKAHPQVGPDSAHPSSSPSSPSSSVAAGQVADPDFAAEAASAMQADTARQKLTVLVNGIEPPLETPIAWLHANLHAPDYFLYIVVHLREPTERS